jgi:hypothetical protein
LATGGTVSIMNATFDHNFGVGGAIGSDATTTLVIADSAFIENRAEMPAAGSAAIGNGGTAVVTNTTFAHNVVDAANPFGGTIVNGGNLILVNSTLADNQGGGALNGNTMNATTILANTISQDCRGLVTSVGNNLIGDRTGCSISLQPGDLAGDPGLGPFRDNGNPGNAHFPLLPTSQAIDAGNDALCPRTDQIRRRRIGPCDIGAVAFYDRDDRRRETDDAPPTAQGAAAVALIDMSGLVANLVQAVITLKSASAGYNDIFHHLKSVLDLAGVLAEGGVSEGISTGK